MQSTKNNATSLSLQVLFFALSFGAIEGDYCNIESDLSCDFGDCNWVAQYILGSVFPFWIWVSYYANCGQIICCSCGWLLCIWDWQCCYIHNKVTSKAPLFLGRESIRKHSWCKDRWYVTQLKSLILLEPQVFEVENIHLKYIFSHYLDDRAINERDHHDRRYVEEYRNDFCEVYDHRHYHRDYEKSHHHHYSKSSGRSRKSSHKRKHKRHHCSSHQSHSVWAIFNFIINELAIIDFLSER